MKHNKEMMNIVFTAIFAAEAVFKIYALGFKRYFKCVAPYWHPLCFSCFCPLFAPAVFLMPQHCLHCANHNTACLAP